MALVDRDPHASVFLASEPLLEQNDERLVLVMLHLKFVRVGTFGDGKRKLLLRKEHLE